MSSQIPTTNFNFDLIDPATKSLEECQEYIKQYFVPLRDGNHAIFENGKYEIKDKIALKDVYFNRMPEYISIQDGKLKKVDLNDWYFKKYTGIKTITYELNKDVFYDDKFNLCPKMKHDYIKYEENKKVNIMLNYIKEVLASGNEEVYKYILQWLSYMVIIKFVAGLIWSKLKFVVGI